MLRQKLKYNFEQGIRLLGQIIVGTKLFDFPILMNIRDLTYRILFGFGKGFHCGHNCFIDREHQKYDGSIQVGEHVLFAHNADIDYTGGLIIGNGVAISDGTKILTHNHDHLGLQDESIVADDGHRTFVTPLIIGDNVLIYARCLIMPGVTSIGENSIISAGSIVTQPVPPNVLVAGNPAKVVAKIKHQRVDYRYTKS